MLPNCDQLPFFVSPYPDELLYSIIARFHVRSRNPSSSSTLKDLFGNKSYSASIEFPKHLDELCRRIRGGSNGFDSETIIQRSTMLPLFRPFVPQERAERAAHAMRTGDGSVHMLLGLTGSALRSSARLRFCPVCVEKDREHFGVAYWHRTHQVAGVLACPYHCVRLAHSNVSIVSRQSQHAYVSLEHAGLEFTGESQGNQGADKPMAEEATEHEIAIALMVYRILNDQALLSSPDQLRKKYISRLMELGFATRNSRVRRQELLEAFEAFYGRAFLAELHCSIDRGQKLNWLFRAFYESEKQMHPIRHLLLMRFVGITPEESLYGTMNDDRNLDHKEVQTAFGGQKAHLQGGPKAAGEHGICQNRGISLAVSEQNHTVPCDLQKKREAWLQLLKANEGKSRTELRWLNQRLFGWLQKKDPVWFEEHAPVPLVKNNRSDERVDWGKRDEALALQVVKAVEQLKLREKPVRITVRAIGTHLGHLWLFQKHFAKLPKTKTALEPHLESIQDFQMRRLRVVAEQLQSEGELITERKLIRTAAIHPSFIEDLSNYTRAFIENLNWNNF